MKNLVKGFLIAGLFAGLVSCKEKEDFEASIFVDEPETLDKYGTWVRAQYVGVYNIDVLYAWRGQETDLTKNLIPPRVGDVVPFLQVMHMGWIGAYLDPQLEGPGQEIFKPLFPKQIQLLGCEGYNQDGTMVQGTAEGGKKLIMYGLDTFDITDRAQVTEKVRIVHHEFGHLLNQNQEYPLAYKQITPDSYTVTWYNNSDSDARDAGFVSPYSMASPDEDFVETLAIYVTNSAADWNTNFGSSGIIAQKLSIVRNYMSECYDVDIDKLRGIVLGRINTMMTQTGDDRFDIPGLPAAN